MKNIFNRFFFALKVFKNISKFSNSGIKILFYSEGKSYQKYALNIIEVLAQRFPGQILYTSSDIEDKIENLDVENLFIGNGFIMKFFFLTIKAKYFFLTLTDLDNHQIKKTKNIDNYIYYFHAPVSTFKNYTKSAFDNYDMILCNGNYHIEEIRKREEIKNLPKKKLIKSGYFYFDYLFDKILPQQNFEDILIAPSWNYDHKNYINETFIEIIEILLSKKIKTIFRPHPEHFKRSKKLLDNLKKKFSSNVNFYFDNSSENFLSMQKSKCLITDSSGISIEYLLIFKKPILYLNDTDKIHNEDFLDFKNFKSIDQITKDSFGHIFYKEDLNNIELIIDESCKNFQGKIPLINKFINENFFNFCSTKKNFDLLIENHLLK